MTAIQRFSGFAPRATTALTALALVSCVDSGISPEKVDYMDPDNPDDCLYIKRIVTVGSLEFGSKAGADFVLDQARRMTAAAGGNAYAPEAIEEKAGDAHLIGAAYLCPVEDQSGNTPTQ